MKIEQKMSAPNGQYAWPLPGLCLRRATPRPSRVTRPRVGWREVPPPPSLLLLPCRRGFVLRVIPHGGSVVRGGDVSCGHLIGLVRCVWSCLSPTFPVSLSAAASAAGNPPPGLVCAILSTVQRMGRDTLSRPSHCDGPAVFPPRAAVGRPRPHPSPAIPVVGCPCGACDQGPTL